MEREDIQLKKEANLVNCPSCFALNDDFSDFCQRCNSRIGSKLDPLGIVHAEGELWRKATTQKPKPIVLLITWIIFLPVTIIGLGLAFNQAIYDRGSNAFMAFWFGIFTAMIGIYFLYTVTKNYFRMKGK